MSRFKSRFQENEEDSSDINLSPLLDMVFILLIFFVVTTTFVRETGVEVQKPKAASTSQIKDEIVKIAITSEGTLHVHEKQVDLGILESILEREVTKNPEIKVVLIADNWSQTGLLVKVLDKCNVVGIKNTSIAALDK